MLTVERLKTIRSWSSVSRAFIGSPFTVEIQGSHPFHNVDFKSGHRSSQSGRPSAPGTIGSRPQTNTRVRVHGERILMLTDINTRLTLTTCSKVPTWTSTWNYYSFEFFNPSTKLYICIYVNCIYKNSSRRNDLSLQKQSEMNQKNRQIFLIDK